MPVTYEEIAEAFLFVDIDGGGTCHAFLDKTTGKTFLRSKDFSDVDNELPDEINEERSIDIPTRKELGLGKPLVLEFARECLPDAYEEVCEIFNRRGAYGRFKTFLARRHALEKWYDYSNKAEEAALRQWCADNGIEPSD